MASAFGHALTSIAIGSSYSKKIKTWKFLFLGIFCCILPDGDVIFFKLGIPYDSFWGHRGFTHSILFAVLLGVIVSFLFYKSIFYSRKGLPYILFFILCTASHGILDAMTNGGLGVAFFSPFDNARYFLPWRPIKVSPIGAAKFFSEWGIKVIKSELIWIGIPCVLYMVIMKLVRKIFCQ
jgi:inner membrane protein